MKETMKPMPLTPFRLLAVPLVASVLCATVVAEAQEAYVYPKQGQSQEKMEKDKYSCYQWAKNQTGFDPMQQASATAPPPKQSKSSALRGAAGGAAAGAAVGAIAGDAGKGAAIGAASGGLIGGVRKRRSEAEHAEYQQQQTASAQNRRSDYDRAWGACLEGKGYTVK